MVGVAENLIATQPMRLGAETFSTPNWELKGWRIPSELLVFIAHRKPYKPEFWYQWKKEAGVLGATVIAAE